MTLDDAVAAVEATLTTPHLRVDRLGARHDETAYLLLVLDTNSGRFDAGPVANGPRLVDKRSGPVTRLTVPAALAPSQVHVTRPGLMHRPSRRSGPDVDPVRGEAWTDPNF